MKFCHRFLRQFCSHPVLPELLFAVRCRHVNLDLEFQKTDGVTVGCMRRGDFQVSPQSCRRVIGDFVFTARVLFLCMHYAYRIHTVLTHKESTWPVGFLGSPTYVEAMSLGGKLVKMFDGSTNYTRIIIAHDTGLIHA
jgi:hypothetical protein